ncbi:hypothetical protein AHAS_Ahas05G0230900 [Arachis hypogaea]
MKLLDISSLPLQATSMPSLNSRYILFHSHKMGAENVHILKTLGVDHVVDLGSENVSEEVERALAKLGPAKLAERQLGYRAYKLESPKDLYNPFVSMYFGADYVTWLSEYEERYVNSAIYLHILF